MASKQLIFQNAVRDLTTGQFFSLILIDGGTSYTAYIKDAPQPPEQPANVAQITSVGAVPLIAPSGAGDVVGLGTTNHLVLWTNGPGSVVGDSKLIESALGAITWPAGVRQAFSPDATIPGFNVGSVAGDPSTPANGDLWYDSTGNTLRVRINGATISIGSGMVPFNLVGSSATAFTVAKAGTDYSFQVDTSAANAVTGIEIIAAASGAGVTIATISSNATENLRIRSKGFGRIDLCSSTTTTFSINTGSQIFGSCSTGIIGWTASATDPTAALDSALSRISPGLIAIGTGAAASFAGSVQLTNLTCKTVGGGILIAEGANATMGTGVLNGTTEVTISTTKVTANSRIFLAIQAPGGTPLGVIYVSSRIAGTSFGVKGAATDTSTFAWWIVEPA